ADSVQIDRAVLLHRGQSLSTHPAFADHSAHAVAFDDLALIRFFADAGGRAGGGDPVIAVFQHDGAAVVERRALQADRRLILHQVGMNGVTTREHFARDQHDVADLKPADLFFGDWRA